MLLFFFFKKRIIASHSLMALEVPMGPPRQYATQWGRHRQEETVTGLQLSLRTGLLC